jgi:hypothetical protein
MPHAGLSVPRGRDLRSDPPDDSPRRQTASARDDDPIERTYRSPRPVAADGRAPTPGYERRAARAREAVASGRISDARDAVESRPSARASAGVTPRPSSRVSAGAASRPSSRAGSRVASRPTSRAGAGAPSRPSSRAGTGVAPPPTSRAGAGVPGRRTVTIQGRGAERYTPKPRRRSARRPHERAGFKPDRVALWAVLLGFLLVLAAATSSHAAVLHSHAAIHALALTR